MKRPIDSYLEELAGQLRAGRVRRWRFLREIEAHLEEAAAEEQARGVSPGEAESRAIARLGPVEAIARAYAAEVPRSRAPAALLIAAGIAVSVSVAGAVIAVGAVFGSSDARRPLRVLGDGSVSALARGPRTLEDRPPDLPPGGIFSAGRLVYRDGRLQIWLAPGSSKSICEVEVAQQADGVGGGGCAPRSALRTGAIYSVSSKTWDGPATIVGVVDDAVRSVGVGSRTIPVRNNVFVVYDVSGDRITLELRTRRGSKPLVLDDVHPPLHMLLGGCDAVRSVRVKVYCRLSELLGGAGDRVLVRFV